MSVEGVEEDLPAGTTPHGMIRRPRSRAANPQAGGFLEILKHVLGLMLVLADQSMDVIRHDRTGVTRVVVFADRLGQSISN